MAGKTVKELVTKWGFKVDKKPLMEMKKSISEVKANLMTLGAAAAANALAIFGFAEHTANAANQMRLGAIRAGMNAQAFQEMAYAAKLSGVDTEGFTISMMHLNRTMFAARMGSGEAVKAFTRLGGGVAQAVAHGRPSQEILRLMADRFKAMKDPAASGALAMQIFGRSGAMLLPMLKQGSKGIEQLTEKAREMGLIFDDETIESSHEFHLTLEELKGSLVGFKNVIGAALIKPVTQVIRAMVDWMGANRKLINSQIKEFFKGISQSLVMILAIFKRLGEGILAITKVFGGLGNAMKLIITLFTAMKIVSFLGSLGSMAMAIYEVAKAWRFMGAAATLADLAAAAIPIAIGLAVAAVILLIEDLIGYFQGKNSLIGVVEQAFKEHFPNAFKFLQNMLTTSLEWFRAWGKTVSDIFMFIPNKLAQFAPSLFGSTAGPGAGTLPSGPGASPLPSGPTSSLVGGAQNSTSVQMNSPINVTVGGSNASPHEIGETVQDHVQKGLERALRPAHRALSPGEVY